MGFFVVDVESDGPIPPDNSMICYGVVYVDIANNDLSNTFYGTTRPLKGAVFVPESLAISGITHEEHEVFKDPLMSMQELDSWIKHINRNGHPIMFSDNLAYDWQWINYYFHHFLGYNPFGYSGRRIGDIYCGLTHDLRAKWKHLRQTKHTHNPVDDAKGNAEVLLHMLNKMELK